MMNKCSPQPWSQALTRYSLLLTAFILLIFSSAASQSEVYKWTDDVGRIHYGDAPKTEQAAETVVLKINSYKSVTIEPVSTDNQTRSSTKKVVMYSTTWCGYCKKARQHFIANKIAFSEYDIEKSKAAHRHYQKLGGTGSVPLIIVGKRKMQGFSVARFNKLYP
jgi:glutaredoxin